MKDKTHLIMHLLRTISIPCIRLCNTVIILWVLSTYGNANQFVIWAVFIMGVIWAFSFYYDEYRLSKLEGRFNGNNS